MPITKRKSPPKRRVKLRAKPKPITGFTREDVDRMGELLAAGHGTEEHARLYFKALYSLELQDLQSIATRAEKEMSWNFMGDALMQATDLYVLSSILYEKYPEHVFLSDAAFDYLAKFLLKNFDKMPKDFREWYAITTIDLEAGTGHAVLTTEKMRWMVFILTGNWMEGHDDGNRPRLLRKRKAVGGKSAAKGAKGKGTRRYVRRASRREA